MGVRFFVRTDASHASPRFAQPQYSVEADAHIHSSSDTYGGNYVLYLFF